MARQSGNGTPPDPLAQPRSAITTRANHERARQATVLAAIAAAAIFVFMQEHQPIIVLGAVVFAVGWCWFWLCRRHPLIAIAIFGFLRGLLGGRR